MTFLHPWFLLGSALAAVPVIIHLWFRKRLKKIPFSTLQFLKSTEARRFGWLRLREWLILLTRCLFVLFLFVGLARPHLKSTLFGMGRLASVYLIADNSYSMAYGDNIERMKELVRQVISHYSPNSEFCVIPLCGERTGTEYYWMRKESALHALDRIDLAYTRGSIREAVERVPELEAKHIVEYVYVGDGQVENFRDFPVRLSREGDFFWVMVPAGGNIGISRVLLKDPVAVPLQTYTMQVSVGSSSPRAWSGKIGVSSGDYYAEQECRLQPWAETVVDFEIPVEYVNGKVQIFDDSLLPDNVYYFIKQLPHGMKILLIGDSPYLIRALQSESGADGPSEMQVADRIGNTDLRRYDIVVLAGLREISDSERLRLVDFLSRPGTGLIVTLDDSVGSNLSEMLGGVCRIQESMMPKGYVVVDWVDTNNRIFDVFEDERAMRDVQFYRYVRVSAQRGVLARFSTGDPCIIVHGNKAVIAGRMIAQSTNFVYKASFVPVFLRLLVSFVAGSKPKEFYVGESVAPLDWVRTPAGDLLDSDDSYKIPGFHSYDSESLCVNVEPGEGNLRAMSEERAGVLHIRQVDPGRDLTGSDLSTFFLILALLAVVFELGLILLR